MKATSVDTVVMVTHAAPKTNVSGRNDLSYLTRLLYSRYSITVSVKSMDSRPTTSVSHRPPSPSMRSFTASTQRSAFSGTLGRLSERPGTRTGPPPTAVISQISIPDRPITQHGLVAPKTTTSRSSQRQIQDKTYFVGLLKTKMTELNTEIGRLQRDNDARVQEQAAYATYEKKAEALAAELKELQGEMADHNLLVDKLNTDADMEDVREEYRELKVRTLLRWCLTHKDYRKPASTLCRAHRQSLNIGRT